MSPKTAARISTENARSPSQIATARRRLATMPMTTSATAKPSQAPRDSVVTMMLPMASTTSQQASFNRSRPAKSAAPSIAGSVRFR